MCGRFAQTSEPELLVNFFGLLTSFHSLPRYNLAPTQPILTVRPSRGERMAHTMRWGFVPPSAKDLKGASKMINARAETVFDRPSFAYAARHQRCIIPSDGFYEWTRTDQGSSPTLFQPTMEPFFSFAGIWSAWSNDEGQVIYTTSILTTSANEIMTRFHHRMPVILDTAGVDTWLDESINRPSTLSPLLKPSSIDAIRFRAVSSRVNSVRNDDPQCWSSS
jgi:putative SOS response-associated peptidase YedK